MANEADIYLKYILPPLDEQQQMVAYLDGLPPSLRFGDASRSALMLSILDKAFKGEL